MPNFSVGDAQRVFCTIRRNVNTLRSNFEILSWYVSNHFTGDKAMHISGFSDMQDDLDRIGEKAEDSAKTYELYLELTGKFSEIYKSFLDLISSDELRTFKYQHFEACEEFETFEETNGQPV